MAQNQGRVKPATLWAGGLWPSARPALLTLLVMSLLVAAVIIIEGEGPLALARLGTRYSLGDPAGTEGYDGQFVYYIARNPDPQAVRPFLDVPAYRYQRILLPMLGWVLSFGVETWLPWVLVTLGVLSQAAGVWGVARLFEAWGTSVWYALVYGLYAGFSLAVRLDLPEPLAYGLVAWGLYAHLRNKTWLSALLMGLALLAKETVVFFPLALLADHLWNRRWRPAALLAGIALLPYALFQVWLWATFGQPGIGSGGAMATPFEAIPFWGLLQVGRYSQVYLLMMLVVFGPAILLPTLWGLWVATRKLLAGDGNFVVFGLLANALVMAFLPFSTYRETGGLLRFSCGLALAVLLFAACYKQQRVLNYSVFWLALNAFLFK